MTSAFYYWKKSGTHMLRQSVSSYKTQNSKAIKPTMIIFTDIKMWSFKKRAPSIWQEILWSQKASWKSGKICLTSIANKSLYACYFKSRDSSQIHRDRKESSGHQGLAGREDGELLFNGLRISVLQSETGSEDGRWWQLHNKVNVPNTTELYT